MTTQETIETLKIAIAEVEWNYPMEYAVAFENAIESLEKQIPKKPMCHENYYFMCANCKNFLDFEKDDIDCGAIPPKYCKHCGQALDWSDTK